MSATSRNAASRARTLVSPLQTSILAGAELGKLLDDEIDELALRCGAPATARGPWLAGTASAVRDREPWAVVVRDADDLLRAAVVLLECGNDSWDIVTLAGSAMGHRSAVLADSAAAAALLGDTFAETVQARSRPARVELGPVDTGAPWLAEFVATVPGAEIVPADPIPAVHRTDELDANRYLNPSIRRTLRKAANRAVTDRRHVYARITRDRDEIAEMLPDLERVHRERDHAQGRRSELDDVPGRRIWTARLTRLAAEHVLELATLHIDGELAADVVAIADPPGYRVMEGNLATTWARYAPGRVLEAAILQRMLDEPAFDHLDWMTAVASDRLLAANAEQPVSMIRVDYPGRARS
jgi:hypothetical protein